MLKESDKVRNFYYNQELLLDIMSDESLVLCASLGSGKSESVKQFISTTKKNKILLVVNEKEAQRGYYEDLPDRIIVHNTVERGVESTTITNFKEAYSEMTEEKNILCITKSKFNSLLIVRPNILMTFHKIIIDEANGLNPIMVSDLNMDIDKVIGNITPLMALKSDIYYNNITEIIRFLKGIKNKYEDSEHLPFYKEDVAKELQIIAQDMLRGLRRLYEEEKIFGLKNTDIFFGMLNCIAHNSVYLGDMNIKGRKSVCMLFANTFLNEYIKSSSTTIKILDGTALNIRCLYDWLGIKVKSDYTCNSKEYPNLKIHLHRYKNLTPAKGRNNMEYTQKVVEDMVRLKRNEDILTFATLKVVTEGVLNNDFDINNINYVMSGKDVGFNGFRDLTDMNIIYFQTLPQHYRMLYNRIFKGMTFEQAYSKTELKTAEAELMGAMLCQLIGRLKIRSNNLEQVNIYCYCVSIDTLSGIVDYFKIKPTNVVLYDEVDIGIALNEVKEKDIILKLESEMNSGVEKLIMVDWIREKFYNVKTPDKTIGNCYGNIKKDIIKLCELKGYALVSKRGKGNKAYIEKVVNPSTI